MVLRNAVKLGYPFELAIKSLRPLCDEVVVLVDPTSEDDTLARAKALGVDHIVESVWDMTNHRGHTNCEISIQTEKVCTAASGDWIFSLQADEMLHEGDTQALRNAIRKAEGAGVSGLEMKRLYFYGSLEQYRVDWTIWLLRLFRRGRWKPDVDGAMRFDPLGSGECRMAIDPKIYHYSRVGNPQMIADRVKNLDGFFHAPEAIAVEAAPYDFEHLRKLDTYVKGASSEIAEDATLAAFPLDGHPAGVRDFFAHA